MREGPEAVDDATLMSRPTKMSKTREGRLPGTDTGRTEARPDVKRARLKKAIDRGFEDADAGRVVVLDADAQIDRFFKRL